MFLAGLQSDDLIHRLFLFVFGNGIEMFSFILLFFLWSNRHLESWL